jgi:hypothetical protein
MTAPLLLAVDANVAVKLYLAEALSREANDPFARLADPSTGSKSSAAMARPPGSPFITLPWPGSHSSRPRRVRVYGPMMTIVRQQTRCGSMQADPADVG